ncbi:hypothetical protein ACIBI8_09360 [Streptomyces sp. NPDC050529]|nr:hypothetical protein [Streptomyces sp. NBC_01022]WRZ79407.1 hypothetical protein OG316_03585 [Streptomyces sp. NBC_01022]WRZ86269.1 hypothetical protein OG316_41310 [Streptomyces sp. NBC_01022]
MTSDRTALRAAAPVVFGGVMMLLLAGIPAFAEDHVRAVRTVPRARRG